VLGQPAVLGSSWRGSPRQPLLGRCARTRRDRYRPGGGPLRQDRRGGATVPSRDGVDDPGHSAGGALLVSRGGAGVAAPFALGWLVGAWIVPQHSWQTHAFLGATLCATSVGITARVLQDIGKSRGKEARIILGAAVVDDVLGLITLAAISGSIVAAGQGGASTGVWPQVEITLKAVGFLAGSLLLGTWITPRLFAGAARLRGRGS